MTLPDNKPLQTDLAAVFVTQATDPTVSKHIELPPNEAIAKLQEMWRAGSGATLAFYQLKDGQQTGGHAVTPVAIEDRGNGKMGIILFATTSLRFHR